MNHFILSAKLTSIFSLVATVFIFLCRQKSHQNTILGIYWFSIAFWAFFVGYQSLIMQKITPMMWGWFLHLGCTFIPVLLFHFVLSMTNNNKMSYKRILSFSYIITVSFNILNLVTNAFTTGTEYRVMYAYPKPSFLYPLYFLLFIFLVVISSYLLVQHIMKAQTNIKRYLYGFLITHLLAFSGAMDNFLIMIDVHVPLLYPYGLYPAVLYAIMTTVASYKLSFQTSKISY